MKGLLKRRAVTWSGVLATALAAVAITPGVASASLLSGVTSLTQAVGNTAVAALNTSLIPVDTSSCGDPLLVQPFTGWNDDNWYTLAPGQQVDDFGGAGWTLLAGAHISTAPLYDGATGSVLDLPSGSVAISPPMCVASDYPTARTMVQTAKGTQISVGVTYAGVSLKTLPETSGLAQGTAGGWSLSAPLQVHPGNQSGWQLVQFIFEATGLGGSGQVYNFYVDPRMSR